MTCSGKVGMLETGHNRMAERGFSLIYRISNFPNLIIVNLFIIKAKTALNDVWVRGYKLIIEGKVKWS